MLLRSLVDFAVRMQRGASHIFPTRWSEASNASPKTVTRFLKQFDNCANGLDALFTETGIGYLRVVARDQDILEVAGQMRTAATLIRVHYELLNKRNSTAVNESRKALVSYVYLSTGDYHDADLARICKVQVRTWNAWRTKNCRESDIEPFFKIWKETDSDSSPNSPVISAARSERSKRATSLSTLPPPPDDDSTET